SACLRGARPPPELQRLGYVSRWIPPQRHMTPSLSPCVLAAITPKKGGGERYAQRFLHLERAVPRASDPPASARGDLLYRESSSKRDRNHAGWWLPFRPGTANQTRSSAASPENLTPSRKDAKTNFDFHKRAQRSF